MRDLYLSLSGAMAQEQRLAVVASNLANANTVGFKKDQEVFSSYLPKVDSAAIGQSVSPEAGLPPVNPNGLGDTAYAMLSGTFTDYSQGVLQPTNNPFDMAVEGPGFFTVKTDQGERYTRAGNFRRDGKGQLTTQDGQVVVGSKGPITIHSANFAVADDGSVVVDGQRVGKLKLVRFADPRSVEKTGGNLFKAADAKVHPTEVTPADHIRVRQNVLEMSNVNMVDEMTQMITTERAYQMSAKAMETVDHSYQTNIQLYSQP